MKYLVIVFLLPITVFSQNLGYYKLCEGLAGDSLKSCLHDIIEVHKSFPYTSDKMDVWDVLKISDRDTLDSTRVICVYSGVSCSANAEAKEWEREHIWSQSHGQFGRYKKAGTDLHHLKPVLSITNRSKGKSNRDFAEGGEELLMNDGSSTKCFVSDSTFEPRSEVKGDIARMLFYMAVRWEGDEEPYDLELVDYVTRNDGSANYGKLSTLLKWHQEDPVDNFETFRNEIIFNYQKNRNPFIDHPEWVFLIWDK